MATEASLANQEADKEVEEMKVGDHITDASEVSVVSQLEIPQAKQVEGLNDENEISTVSEPEIPQEKEEEGLKEVSEVSAVSQPEIPQTKEVEGLNDANEMNAVTQPEIPAEKEEVGLKDVNEVSVVTQPEIPQAKDEEGLKVEDSTTGEALFAEQKESSDVLRGDLYDDVKMEEENKDGATKKVPDSEVEQTESIENSRDYLAEKGKTEEEMKDPEITPSEMKLNSEVVERVEEAPVYTEGTDSLVADVKKEDEEKDVHTEKEGELVALVAKAAEETTESEPPMIQESEPASIAVPELLNFELKAAEHPDIEDKAVELITVPATEEGESIPAAPDASESAEATKDEEISPDVVASSEPSKHEPFSNEISGLVAASSDQVSESKDAEAILPEVTGAPENPNDNFNTNNDIKESLTEESASDGTVLNELPEVEEKAAEEEPTLSSTLKDVATDVTEVSSVGGGAENTLSSESVVDTPKDLDAPLISELPSETAKASEGVNLVQEDGNFEGDNTSLTEASRDLVVEKEADTEPKANEPIKTTVEKSVDEESEDKQDGNEAQKEDNVLDDGNSKTEGEALAVKSSKPHSNSLISKVKQSMVKVKKAIIGKSSSSKKMSPETKDGIEAE